MVKKRILERLWKIFFRNFNRGRKRRELRHSSWRRNLRVWRTGWEQEATGYSCKFKQYAIFSGAWETGFWNRRFVFHPFSYSLIFLQDKDSIPNSPTTPAAPVSKLELHAKSWKVKKNLKKLFNLKKIQPKVKTARQIRAERFHAEQKRKAFAAENAAQSGANSPQKKSEAKESQVQTRKPRFPGQFRKPSSARPFAPKPAGPSANRYFTPFLQIPAIILEPGIQHAADQHHQFKRRFREIKISENRRQNQQRRFKNKQIRFKKAKLRKAQAHRKLQPEIIKIKRRRSRRRRKFQCRWATDSDRLIFKWNKDNTLFRRLWRILRRKRLKKSKSTNKINSAVDDSPKAKLVIDNFHVSFSSLILIKIL